MSTVTPVFFLRTEPTTEREEAKGRERLHDTSLFDVVNCEANAMLTLLVPIHTSTVSCWGTV
jgi:hypothetical protein